MIKKILNWTLGSFFRTFGRILFYIFLALLLTIILSSNDIKIPGLFNVLDVHAAQSDNWFYNVKNYGTGSYWYINHTISGTTWLGGTNDSRYLYYDTVEIGTNGNYPPLVRYFEFPRTTDAVNIGTNGVSFTFFSNELLNNGFIYNINTYFCASSSLNSTSGYLTNGSTSSNVINGPNSYSTTVRTDLSNVFAPNSNDILKNCNVYSSLLLPKNQGAWLNIKLTSNSNVNTYLYFIGYDIKPLGVDSGTISNIINSSVSNSGLASASSVQEVQRSINQVQQDINNVNSSINNQTQQQHQDHQETINTLTDDNTSQATNSASSFFNNFSTNTHGLTSIITAPLSAIQSLTSKTCNELVLPLPYVNENLTLPCMRNIYIQYFGNFMVLYDTITLGIIAYWVLVRIFGLVKDFKNPEHDEIEVVDL